MIDNVQYVSAALSTTERQSVDNQYIDCASMQSSIWSDFGDLEVEPSSLILHSVIGVGHFGIVWKGR